MAGEDDIRVNIVADFEVENSKKQINEIGNYFESKIGKSIANSVDIGKNKSLATFKNKLGTYTSVLYNVTQKHRKVKGGKGFEYDVLGDFTAEQTQRLQGSKTLKNYRANLKIIQKEQKQAQAEENKIQKKQEKEQQVKREKQNKFALKFVKTLGNKLLPTGNFFKSTARLFKTIQRVGFYRIARNVFRLLENGFKQGINGLIEVDSTANETISKLTTAYEKFSASLTLIAMPALEALVPLITGINDSIVNFANGISMASASMKGLSEYTKISSQYTKDLANQSNKLSFDKFEAMSGQDSVYEKGIITEKDTETIQQYIPLVQKIQEVVNRVWNIIERIGKTLGRIFTETIEPNIDKIIDFMISVIEFFATVGTKILEFVSGNGMTRLLTILGVIAGAVSVFAGFMHQWGIAIKAGLLAVALGAGNYAISSGNGSLAGSNITNIVNTNPRLQTSSFISNQSATVASAMSANTDIEGKVLSALYTWGGSQSDGGDVVLNLDGAEIARSKRFVGEMNRNNSGLNLR